MAPVMEERKKQRYLGGPSDGREEEAGMPNPHTCSGSNRASIFLAAIEQVSDFGRREERLFSRLVKEKKGHESLSPLS